MIIDVDADGQVLARLVSSSGCMHGNALLIAAFLTQPALDLLATTDSFAYVHQVTVLNGDKKMVRLSFSIFYYPLGVLHTLHFFARTAWNATCRLCSRLGCDPTLGLQMAAGFPA